ncbi:NADP oxidoreductase [Brucellaceae bacterium VT-16-1752]|nr:NADP oxidoreductase [Brucellaceae bacterium VT-16-1752]
MSSKEIETIGILGAGKVGTAIARQAVKAGYKVLVATAKRSDEISLIVEMTAPGAQAISAETAVRDSDVVVLALPLNKYRTLDPALLNGKIVIDVMNYWAPTDGVLDEFEGGRLSSEIVQDYLEGARLVRTLNHIGYHELEEDGLPRGHADRRALAVASDDPEARAMILAFSERLGFDAVNAGALINSREFAAGTEIFSRRHQREEMEAHFSGAAPVRFDARRAVASLSDHSGI